MKISINWLKQYVSLPETSIARIANQLTMKTAEVEEVKRLGLRLDGLALAKVTAMEAADDAHAWLTVDVGQDRRRTTLCAAPNARLGMTSVFAPAGATLSDGRLIGEVTKNGRSSQGMLLSPAELGISQYHDLIMDLPSSLAAGAPLSELIPAEDYIIEIDNKSLTHRPDLWGHYGFARELAAIYKLPLRPLEVWDLKKYDNLPAYPLSIDDLDLCPGYACLAIDNLKPEPSPLWMQMRLYSVGLRAINLLVDLTNYLMLELGQPMHAFDGDYVSAVRVAAFGKNGGAYQTLDGTSRQMLSTDLMIWNQEQPVGIAGVMGGLNSEVSAATRRIVLESANFQPAAIRRTSIRLGLRTDASIRFEKDLPKSFMITAIARFLRLCQEAGQPPELRSRLTSAGAAQDAPAIISMDADFISRRVGEDIPGPQLREILEALGFTVKFSGRQLQVTAPPQRSLRDISIPEDIVEEVARFYGYDNITPKLPAIDITPYEFNENLRAEHKLRRLLSQARHFNEVHSYSWYDDRWLERLGYEIPAALSLQNPIAPYKGKLRQSLIPNLLEFVLNNYDQRSQLRFYEIGHCYWPQAEAEAEERALLGAVIFKAGAGGELEEIFRHIKGVLADSMTLLNVDKFTLQPFSRDLSPWAQAGAGLEVMVEGAPVGALGYLSGPILSAFKRNAQIAWLELALPALSGRAFPKLSLKMPSIYPGSWLDFSVVWPKKSGFQALEQILRQYQHPLMEERQFITFYEGKGLEAGMRSYSFRYRISSGRRTLNKEDIDGFQQGLLSFLADKGIKIRA
jgi:phenylalanyl-tRNA synthetase beta chain